MFYVWQVVKERHGYLYLLNTHKSFIFRALIENSGPSVYPVQTLRQGSVTQFPAPSSSLA